MYIYRGQLDEAIAECQIEKGVTFRLLDTAQEVSEWIYRYSKSVAEHPYKYANIFDYFCFNVVQ